MIEKREKRNRLSLFFFPASLFAPLFFSPEKKKRQYIALI